MIVFSQHFINHTTRHLPKVDKSHPSTFVKYLKGSSAFSCVIPNLLLCLYSFSTLYSITLFIHPSRRTRFPIQYNAVYVRDLPLFFIIQFFLVYSLLRSKASNIWNKFIKFRYKLIANFIPYLSSLVYGILFAFCVSYAVKPVRIKTPGILITNIKALRAIRMFTILAIIIPIKPINKTSP